MVLANVLAALQAGVTGFDSAVGGLGGCPFASGATGNVSTEDLVHMLDLMGVESGVDLDAMLGVAREVGRSSGIRWRAPCRERASPGNCTRRRRLRL